MFAFQSTCTTPLNARKQLFPKKNFVHKNFCMSNYLNHVENIMIFHETPILTRGRPKGIGEREGAGDVVESWLNPWSANKGLSWDFI